MNNRYEKYSKYQGYDDFSKTEKREYEKNNQERNQREIIKKESLCQNNISDYENARRIDENKYNLNNTNTDDQDNNYIVQNSDFLKTESFNDDFYNSKKTLFYPKNDFPHLPIEADNIRDSNKKFSQQYVSDNKVYYRESDKTNNRTNYEFTAESLLNTNSNGYNPIKINEVSKNDKKIELMENKINSQVLYNTDNRNNTKSPIRKFDEASISNDFKMLDKLKSKIKDLENKIGEINNGNKLCFLCNSYISYSFIYL